MRLSSSILLISAAILTCDTESEISVFNHFTRPRPDAGTDSADPVKRLLGTHESTNIEDRAPFPLATAAVLTDVSKTRESVLNNWKRSWMRPPLVNPFERSGNGAYDLQSEAIPLAMMNEDPVVRKGLMTTKKPELQTLTPAIAIKYPQDSAKQILVAKKKKQEADERTAKVKEWLSEGLSIDDVFSLLKLNTDRVDVQKESNLRTLQLFITQYKMEKNTKDTLIQALVRGFSDEPRLALCLSVAKEHPGDRILASTLQMQLMKDWLKHEKSVDNVFSMMNIALEASVEDKYLTYTLVDTMDTYIGLYNKAHPDDDPIDAFTYLSTMAGDDRVLALLLSEAKAMGHDTSDHELKLYARWMKKGLVPKKMYFYLISMIGLDHLFFVNRLVADYAAFYKKK